MTYTLFQHRHKFAGWAAARAAQRGWTNVQTLREALERSGIVEFVRDNSGNPLDKDDFTLLHREWCRSAVSFLVVKGVPNTTYGRAAKLVAVYLKAMVVTGPESDTDLARMAHPPVDGLLLQSLAADPRIISPHKRHWKSIKWTQLNENQYYQLLEQLAGCLEEGDPFWMLEQYWPVTAS